MPAYKDFDQIIPGILQGAFPDPPSSAFDVADIVVFCAEEKQPSRTFKSPPGKSIVRLPFDDDPYQPISPTAHKAFQDTAAELARQVRRGQRVLITCAAGLNRSGLVTALTMIHAYRMMPDQAIKTLRSRRRVKHKGDYPLMNPLFEQYVRAQRIR